jgi:hypothetical protein
MISRGGINPLLADDTSSIAEECGTVAVFPIAICEKSAFGTNATKAKSRNFSIAVVYA